MDPLLDELLGQLPAVLVVGPRTAGKTTTLTRQLGERFLAGVVLHTGPHVYRLAERIIAAPIAVLWG